MHSTAALSASAVNRQLADLGVSTIYEASGRQGLLDVQLTRILPGSRAAGPARIAACAQGDNRAVHAALAWVQPGDVLVLSMPDPAPVALLGDLLATQAAAQGVAGILVDAAVRDADELRAVGVPVWTRHIRSTGATKVEPGAIDVPVTIGGALIQPGDIVVLDGDGAVVIPLALVHGVLDASRERLKKEAALRAEFERGVLSYDLYGMRDEDASRDRGAASATSASGSNAITRK